jgi:exonuclease SbcC
MYITRIELENIKSHANTTFEFERGTTSITGANGAGKTTIIEAIAWTLFDLLDYKKDDFVRRGTKRGVARVTFESGLDERLYTVCRDTGTTYFVHDPILKVRVADKKEEVTRFLCKHLGVEPGTDLETLFRRAIGVPQGTFTAVFLESAAERRKAFDKLLKVEEYRRGADELLKTSRHLENRIVAVRERIARVEGELARFDTVEAESKRYHAEAETIAGRLAAAEKAAAERRTELEELEACEKKFIDARSAVDRLAGEMERAQLELRHKTSEHERALEAAKCVDATRAAAERHKTAVGRLVELEREGREAQRLQIEISKVDAAGRSVRAEQVRTRELIANAQTAHKQLTKLRPLVAEQKQLEAKTTMLRESIARASAVEAQIKDFEVMLAEMRKSYASVRAEFKDAEARVADARAVADLQKQDADIAVELARIQTNRERDEQFAREVENGLCPILSQRCLNLKEGERLEEHMTTQFEQYTRDTARLNAERTEIQKRLVSAREAERIAGQLEALKKRREEIEAGGKQLAGKRETLEREAGNSGELKKQLRAAEARLKELADPRSAIRQLEAEVAAEAELIEAARKIDKNIERLLSDHRLLAEQLEKYKDLDSQLSVTTAERNETEEAYRTFLVNEPVASALAARAAELAVANENVERVAAEKAAAEELLRTASGDYSPEAHAKSRTEFAELQNTVAETRALHSSASARAAELTVELQRLEERRAGIRGEQAGKARLEQTLEAAEFIRSTLKDAGPLVARNYVHRVSIEANQMFREISGRGDMTLKWGEDYGISLEQDGYDRPFLSLSGGEQMAAALAIRLGLLKQLSDIRVAFFDEPTTNLDAERRENLAAQIGSIKHFDQLFVISHDDTFEGYMDNEISLGAIG